MRTTLVLEVSNETSEFIKSQQGLVDPSALINKLLREEQDRQGFAANNRKVSNDGVNQALEEYIDQQIPSAG